MIVDVQQQTAEWLQMRVGAVTASRMNDVMAKSKRGGELQCRKDYKAELVCERLTKLKAEHYVTPAMEWGIQHERLARAAYEIETGVTTEPGGLALHDRIKWLMASPDGLVGDKGLVEFKCPTTATHIEYFTAGVVPEEYHWQMLCQMACAQRDWCDFVSYDPRLPESLQLFIRRMEWDDARITEMEAEVEKFIIEVEDSIIALSKSRAIDLPSAEQEAQDFMLGTEQKEYE
jgi:putative phage-type endonuclease